MVIFLHEVEWVRHLPLVRRLHMALAAYEKRELSGRQLAKEVISFEQDKLESWSVYKTKSSLVRRLQYHMIEKSGSFSCVRLDIESESAQINDELY